MEIRDAAPGDAPLVVPPDGASDAAEARLDAALDATRDAGPTRSFRLASTGAQLDLDHGLWLAPADVASDADVIAIHNDFVGVPWDELAAGIDPPAAWIAEMDRLAGIAETARKPLFLSLQIVAGPNRHHLADKAVVVNGKLARIEGWSAACYDFRTAVDGPARRRAFIAYVEWMVARFNPTWLNIGIEMNLFMDCGAAWDGLVDTERAAYEAVKLSHPQMVVFPSFQIDRLHGYGSDCVAPRTRTQCFDDAYGKLARVLRDRFAISTYPHFLEEIRADIPADWFTRAAARGRERLLVAETGWNAVPAVAMLGTTCITALDSSPEAQLAYFDRLVADVEAAGGDLVTWWSNRDLIPAAVMGDCPCDGDPAWCSVVATFRQGGGADPTLQFYGEMVLKGWGTMGLRDYGGAPRPAFHRRWQSLRELPLR